MTTIQVKSYKITASALSNLIELLMVLVIDYVETGDSRIAQKDTAAELRRLAKSQVQYWGEDLPALGDAVNAALTGRNKAHALALLGSELKDVYPAYRMEEHGFAHEELDLLKSLIQYLRTDSEPALKKIQKMASLVRSPFIAHKMAPEAGDQSKTSTTLRKLVFKLVGRDDVKLTADEIAQLKDTQPEALMKYRTLSKEHTAAWTDALTAYIRKSGHHALPYEEVLEFLNSNGYHHSLLPGFTGLIDDRRRLYTTKGQAIDGLPSPAVYTNIRMNEQHGKSGAPEYVFVAVKPDGSYAAFYTADFKKNQAKQKFAQVALLSKKMEAIRTKWFAVVKKFRPDSEQAVASVALEMLFEFSARVGGVGNAADGKPTYGIATLLVKHVMPASNGDILIRYAGKAGVKTVHKIAHNDPNQKFLIKPVMALIEGKSPNDRLLTYLKGGRPIVIGPNVINRYFKAYGAGDMTVHKIRTYHGTKVFQELLMQVQAKKPPKTEKEAMILFNKMAEAVGKKLNHIKSTSVGQKVTGTTALQNYIDPTVQVEYWRSLGYRPPKFLEKFDA